MGKLAKRFADADVGPAAASQAEAEAGTEAGLRAWSPLRIKQAILALGGAVYSLLGHTHSYASTDHDATHAPGGSDALPWSTAHGRGTTIAKPAAAAGNAGYLYFDIDLGKLQRSTGATWEDCAESAGAPAAHAASHTNGGDDIQTATAGQKGVMSAAAMTKLDGIETAADVTDAGNVEDAITGAAAETTPDDAWVVPVIVSAVLKKITWANLKAVFTPAAHAGSAAATAHTGLGTAAAAATTDFEPAAAVSGHAALTTGVHGVGAGTVAKTSDIPGVASTSALGMAPQATAPAAGLLSVLGIANGETVRTDKAIFDTTNPEALGSVGPGSQVVAARRDHVHPTIVEASTSGVGMAPQVTAPGAGLLNVLAVANGQNKRTDQALFDATVPEALGVAAAGTAMAAARRDHVHTAPATHDAVTLDTNADTLLSLSTQALGLDTQTAATVLAGPATGAAAVPTFRALAATDIPALSYAPTGAVPASTFTQNGGILVGTGAGTYQEETGATLEASIGLGAIGKLATKAAYLSFEFDGGGAALTAGAKALWPALKADFTPTRWTVKCSANACTGAAANASVAFTVTVGNFSTSGFPAGATGGTQPSVTTAVGNAADSTFTDLVWSAGQEVMVEVASGDAKWAILVIEGTVTA